MSSKNTSDEKELDAVDGGKLPSVDDFIRELEEKERDLHISSDLVIEVGESSVEHDNIHDSFVSTLKIDGAVAKPVDEKGESAAPVPDFDPQAQEESVKDMLSGQVEDLIAERDGLVDSLRRQKIDFENFRSRAERDRQQTFKNILSSLASQILPVLDNLDRALDSTTDRTEFNGEELQKFVEGIVLVNQQMNEVLVEMGVKPIVAIGEDFDPNFHDAVDCVYTDEHPPNTVVEELLRGYVIEDRVIRPAIVKVSAPANSSEQEEIPTE